MSAIDALFQRLRGDGRKALMPFVTAGDPDLQFTAALLKELAVRGAALCEVGFPYSDPIADGPVIQTSYTRALGHGIKLAQILEMTRRVAPELATPLVGMVSYAIICRHGPERFVAEAAESGLAGLIVPDLLVEESAEMVRICKAADVSLVHLVTPTTSRQRAKRIAEASSGFIYYVSVTGITGERQELPSELADNVAWLREQTRLPICIGFGISRPEHVRALAPVADGLIVGSAIMRRIADINERSRDAVVRDIGGFVAELLAAFDTRPAA